jgi:hypothetical protein
MKMQTLQRRLQSFAFRRRIPRRIIQQRLVSHHAIDRCAGGYPGFDESQLAIGEIGQAQRHELPIVGMIIIEMVLIAGSDFFPEETLLHAGEATHCADRGRICIAWLWCRR